MTQIDLTEIAAFLDAVPQNRRDRIMQAVAVLNEGLLAGSIRNKVLSDAKQTINYPIYNMFDIAYEQYKGSISTVLDCARAAKKLPADHPAQPALRGAVVLHNTMESLKSVVVMGRAPNPNAKPVFVPGAAAQAVLDQINAVLTEQIASSIDEFVRFNTNYYVVQIDAFMASHTADPNVQPAGDTMKILLSIVADMKSFGTREVTKRGFMGSTYKTRETTFNYTLRADYKALVEAEMRREAEQIKIHFVTKNASKLGKIVEAKGNFESATTTKISVGQVIEATMRIVFQDGSAFTVVNKVVWKTSTNGLGFAQYPTTFHDVRMADGRKMPMPSEERMNKVFVKTA